MSSPENFYDLYDAGSDKTVVVFGGLASKVGMPIFEFKNSFKNMPVNVIFFRDTERSWYHLPVKGFGNNFSEKGEKVRQIVEEKGRGKIFFVGSSAGGFAAAVFSTFVSHVNSCLLFGPQAFIDKPTRQVLKDGRWASLIRQIPDGCHQNWLEVKQNFKCKLCLISGALEENDIKHSLYAKQIDQVEAFLLTNGPHNSAGALKKAGLLTRVLEDFVGEGGLSELRGVRSPDEDFGDLLKI